ncbi:MULTISPECIES: hypothetical protein [unclassified Methylobacterium]|uniref:hypothetical protein n=1 Tax=unclassified Methylobacterium TaxID=2615210 RepID=UPI0006FBB583|nr:MULTISPECIES: hypothetical protein [unclassified Methylobacterium]KQP30091.1 hypothetical protein ASF25_19675 [Methylobacterium sp. Leaf100]KQP59616.1 hypothetical protein ASF52_12000 [Methylobacterium sp. Leaf112]USU31747.1 hypothetical protein NG677_20995 [Methylobacterium sp. OTU13CASTA1]
MTDLDKALADIVAIRSQLVRGTAFSGYGPAAFAATAGLALATATAQTLLLDDPDARPLLFFGAWVATAVIALGLVGAEMRARARRHTGGLGDAMIHDAVEQFLPAGAAGALLALVLARVSPESLWLLPGLWQVLVSLGIFAGVRVMPRGVALVAAWYLVAGLAVLVVTGWERSLSPWAMGLPFAVGQGLMALVVRAASEADDAEI